MSGLGFGGGAPHLGQATAAVLNGPPQSLHWVKAIASAVAGLAPPILTACFRARNGLEPNKLRRNSVLCKRDRYLPQMAARRSCAAQQSLLAMRSCFYAFRWPYRRDARGVYVLRASRPHARPRSTVTELVEGAKRPAPSYRRSARKLPEVWRNQEQRTQFSADGFLAL